MILTERKYGSEKGRLLDLAHYAVGDGEVMPFARDLAGKIVRNARLPNDLMIHSIARISDMSRADGLYSERLTAVLSQTNPDAEGGLGALL